MTLEKVIEYVRETFDIRYETTGFYNKSDSDNFEEALALAIDALNCKEDYEMVFKAQNEEITELKGQIEYLEKKLYFKQNPWEIDG